MRDCMRSMERATLDSTPRIKFDNDEVTNLLGPKRVPSVSTPKRVGGGTTIHQPVLHPQVGKQLHGGNFRHGMSDIFFERCEGVFACTQRRFPCKRRGVVHRASNPHAMSRSRTRDFSLVVFFVSRVSAFQRLSHAQHVHVAQVTLECCPRKNTCLHTQRSMAHGTLSLMIPPSWSTSSLLMSTPIRPSTRPWTGPLQMSSSDEIYDCDDPTNVSFGSLADLHSPTGYEPRDLAEEDNRAQVNPLFFHRPSMTSTYDSAESIATSPPESDVDDEQTRTMLASPLYLLEREKQVLTDHEFITPSEETQCQVHLTFEKVQENLPQCSHTKESQVKKHFLTEKAISSGHQAVQGTDETLFRFSDPEDAARSVLEEQRNHLLAEPKFEILKQECKVDTLNTCIRKFQRQAHSNLFGDRPCKSWLWRISKTASQTSWRISSARKSTSRNSNQMYPWSGRVEVSSGCASWRILQASIERKSHNYTGAYFTNTGVAGKNELHSDFGEIQDVESICSGKLSHVPSQPTVVPSARSMPGRDQSLRPATWNMLGTSGNVFWLSMWRKLSARQYRETCCEKWRTNRKHNSIAEFCKKTINHELIIFPAEGPQNYMADQQRLQISDLNFDKFPTFSTFSCWKIRFKTPVSSCSDFPSDDM